MTSQGDTKKLVSSAQAKEKKDNIRLRFQVLKGLLFTLLLSLKTPVGLY